MGVDTLLVLVLLRYPNITIMDTGIAGVLGAFHVH